MKIRKGWRITWPDGTKWDYDCRRLALAPIMPGATREAIRITGPARWVCDECLHGTHR